ncbi:carboxylesterase type B [Streptomyces sp. TE12347]
MTDVASEASGPHPHVRAAGGALRGTREDGVAVFRGIPFAEPPVGPLRFAAPRRARPWDGVRPAVSYGPPPPQGGHFGMDVLAREAAGDDWLTVNVWSPEPGPGAELPVMVWIQGGAYSIGMSGLPEYDGGRLARDGGVVVVTFNYRVGPEGFGQIEGTPANRGLLDQVAALEWVRDNIRAFGGDPGRVTVFGQSAGAGSIAALLAMPRAAGLFGRAVAQSVPATFFSPELAADIAAACAAELGLRPTATELSGVDPARLSAAADRVASAMDRWADRWGPAAHRAIPFSPVVDGEILPTTPWQALADGAGRDVDLLVGHTRDETRLLTALDGLLGQVTPEQAARALHAYGPGRDAAHRYREAFPTAGPDELYELVGSDWLFRMPSLHLAQAQAAAGRARPRLRADLVRPGHGRRPRRLPRPRRAAGLRQPGARPTGRAHRREAVPGGGGGVRAHAACLDGVRRPRRPRLARVRQRSAPRAALRHPTGPHRLPGGGLPADLAGPHLPGPAAAHRALARVQRQLDHPALAQDQEVRGLVLVVADAADRARRADVGGQEQQEVLHVRELLLMDLLAGSQGPAAALRRSELADEHAADAPCRATARQESVRRHELAPDLREHGIRCAVEQVERQVQGVEISHATDATGPAGTADKQVARHDRLR